LAVNAPVGGGDPLDGGIGAVGVEADVHGGIPVEIDVLGGDLPVFRQTLEHAAAGDKAALPVGDGDGVDVVRLALHQPGRAVGHHPGAHQHGLVAADGVIGQRRAAV